MFMFSFFRRSAKETANIVAESQTPSQPQTDTALIAVITAAIARIRESEGAGRSEAGFVVKRVRRI
jgi:hypothetical protein